MPRLHTGSTLYLDPLAILSLTQMCHPKLKKQGMIRSDGNGLAFTEETGLPARDCRCLETGGQIELHCSGIERA